MDELTLAGQKLLRLVRPLLLPARRQDLLDALEAEWSAECLPPLLASSDPEVVRAAAFCLGWIGDAACAPRLAALLHHDDSTVVQAAEDALWFIWLRAGGSLGQAVLSRISESLKSGETENVVPLLTELIRAQPSYAEAYHQRSQAHYLLGAYELCLRDARRAVQLNSFHFAALANQGHALAALGRYAEALDIFRQVLRLHPRTPGIRAEMQELRRKLSRQRPAPARL